MNKNPRCLFNSDFSSFLYKDINSIFGTLCDSYHGEALTTTRESWKSEIMIEQLREFYVREAIKTTIKMIKEGDSISDIPEFELLSLHVEGK